MGSPRANTEQSIRDEVASRFGDGLEPLDAAFGRLEALEPEARQLALDRAALIAELHLDPPAVAAALLAPAPPDPKGADTATAVAEEVQGLIEGVARVADIRWGALGSESAENLRRMFVAMAADARVVLIVLAHRVQTMRRLDRGSERAEETARETLEVFAPLANRLGVWQLKWELEDLSLRELEPDIYAELKRLLSETRDRRDAFVDEVMTSLQQHLEEHGVRGRLTGRPKHIYSIYKKMQRKQVGFDQIYDVSAVRLIVDEIKDCYAALGVVHALWAPIPGEFDDYIARPKENGYQSLHTAVVGPGGKSVEIQIRTPEMHEFGEYGVAAHWAYKEAGVSRTSKAADQKFNLLRQLMDWQKDLEDPTALAETLKTDLFRDQVYVFTPTGEVLGLPAGSTPVDFAYRIHTMVGHRCRGALVNGQIVPLHTALKNGDRIEILTKKEAAPSRDWLNPHAGFLNSSGARSKVRAWFRKQGRDDAVIVGKELLERECNKLGVKADFKHELAPLLELHHLRTEDDMLAAIGFGDLGAHTIAGQLLEAQRPPEAEDELPEPSRRAPGPVASHSATGLRVDGIDGVMGQPANCCKPVPGDPVIGFLSRGRGVIIHRRDCSNILHAQEPERLTEIDWQKDGGRRYPVKLEILIKDRRGALRDVVGALSDVGINLRDTSSRTNEAGHTSTVIAVLEIRGSEELERAFARLSRLDVVQDLRRLDD